ncbi:membrane protein insertase YidC [Marinobacter sp.]|uniref:membrane protein insertase YidC n=1 Tax=Marinobacter sp. TaxID=50741 RepID=UPI003850EF4A
MDIQRILLFVGLAIVSYMMVLAWNEDYNQPSPSQAMEERTEAFDGNDYVAEPGASETSSPPAGDEEFSTPEATTSTGVSDTVSASDDRGIENRYITVITDVLKLKVDRIGGHIVEAAMLKHDRTLDSEEPLRLLQNTRNRTYLMESGLIGRDGFDSRRVGPTPVYTADQDSFRLDDNQDTVTLDLSFTSDTGVNVTKQYVLGRDSYEIDVRYRIDNRSNSTWQGNFSGKIVRDQSPDQTAQTSMGIQSFLGLVVSTPEDPYEKYDFEDLREQPLKMNVTGGWLAFLQHYFLTAWIPQQDQTHQFQTNRRDSLYVMGFVSPATVVEPGQTGEINARAYIGPKIIERLEDIAPNLDRTVDFGFLFFIAYPLFVVLDWLHGLVGNWGVAIILLTVVVKALFFKLSATSYRSMARMRAVAPQLTRLKELYGDDRQRMSQEMMALYKKEKINPLGGCLPILVQMPVFISLYWVLFESVQLRHAPFMLWIQDLSVMDPYFILPILMGASMFIQMSLNPTPPDPMQAKVMKMMPVIFTVFFLWFPAGLVLYWLTNNILSIAQQWYITRKIEADMAARKH